MKRKEFLSRIRQAVRDTDKDAEVYLYGSQARNEAKEESDWDILVLTPDTDLELSKERSFRRAMFFIEMDTSQVISTLVYPKETWYKKLYITPLFDAIKKDGIQL